MKGARVEQDRNHRALQMQTSPPATLSSIIFFNVTVDQRNNSISHQRGTGELSLMNIEAWNLPNNWVSSPSLFFCV